MPVGKRIGNYSRLALMRFGEQPWRGDMYIEDAYRFVDAGKPLEGQLSLGQLPRAAGDLPPQDSPDPRAGTLRWRLEPRPEGEGGYRRSRVLLKIEAFPVLVCQRCMQPFVCPVSSEQLLELVRAQPQEARLDQAGFVESSECDKIAAQPSLDLSQLIEDELLLALPIIPRHEICPEGAPAHSPDAAFPDKPSPFAVLGKLKNQN